MFARLFLVLAAVTFFLYLYGILFIFNSAEENKCRMTYMFEYPQFVKIHFGENKKYPKYGLYAYSEGHLTQNARSMRFNGAPVIFIPGNRGSFKQARSLASVALRKGLEGNVAQHLDYFTVDYNEEYSGIYGGFLEDQKAFLKFCIRTVTNLYTKLKGSPNKVILIGHSMGAKIAQSMLTDPEISKFIVLIISISGPIDQPVLNMDFYMEAFYRNVDNYLKKHMKITSSNSTNYCDKNNTYIAEMKQNFTSSDIIFITIGGGDKDKLVHAGLTGSKYSNIHVLTNSIPNVWLSTDHLCAVWCLQLVLVINRFLYSILNTGKRGDKHIASFATSNSEILDRSEFYFMKNQAVAKTYEVNLITDYLNIGDWVEDSRRVYTISFQNGLNQTRIQMIRLMDLPQYEILKVEAINLEDDWIFGCMAVEISNNTRFCSKGLSLSHLIEKMPSLKYKRQFLNINLHILKAQHPSWTHIILRVVPSKEQIKLNVDIHNASGRRHAIQMPKWYTYSTKTLLPETTIGTSFYQIAIANINEAHQVLEIHIKPKICSSDKYHSLAKICIPWIRGSTKFQHITHEKNSPMLINIPSAKPKGLNNSIYDVTIDLHLDPNCRYEITYWNSLGGTMGQIVQQFSGWLPAHLTALLLLSLRHQISVAPTDLPFKCGKLQSALLNCSSFFLITASRVFAKLLTSVPFFPMPDEFHHSLLILVVIHGVSLSILLICTGVLWLAIYFWGNAALKLVTKLINLPTLTISPFMVSFIEKIPFSVGVLLIAIGYASCGGVALISACSVYLIILTKQYENYLEQFFFKTANIVAKKLFGIFNTTPKNTETDPTHADTSRTSITNDAVETIPETPVIDQKNNDNLDNCEELNEEMDKLLKSVLEKQAAKNKDRNQAELLKRADYESIHESLSSMNFHITLFFLLILLTVINLPSTISWAKNYSYSKKLYNDPSIFPATIAIISTSVLWQLSTPRNVSGYRVIASILYVCAAFSLVYCQDSIYRLNAVLSTVFLLVAAHQICAFKKNDQKQNDQTKDEELANEIERLNEMLGRNMDENYVT